ncbi:oligosaccharide flippase family protein [Porticoccaceae bacterium]|nr:oligosaccharide flippase family protein [Porticoccaceae bacterium]
MSVLQIFTYVLPLVTVPYLVRVVGVHNYGLIAFSLSLAALIQIICDYGFNLSATKEVVSQRNSAANLSGINVSVILIKCVLLLAALGLMLAIINFTGDIFKDYWIYFFSLIAAAGNTLLPVWYFQGMEKMKYLLVYGVTSKLAYTCLVFYFVVEPENYILVPLLSGVCGLFTSLLAIGYIRSIGHLDLQCFTAAGLKKTDC